MKLYPTHTCFDDAIDYIVQELAAGNPLALGYRVVHGICLASDDKPYAHAWTEAGQMQVVEGYRQGKYGPRLFIMTPRAQWERQARPQRWTTYTLQEWRQQNEASGHYGPWLQEYVEQCARPIPRTWSRKP